ncbi:MAG: LysR family transcriptional regulator [Peptococcaceae bacterium]|nr:LysR family transcriptional regulator [Peptococcaceae bacterium]
MCNSSLFFVRFLVQLLFTAELPPPKQLGYSQPGISHMINCLENDMGFPLLIRNKDKIIPTENGKKVLYYCYQIVKNANYLQDTASSINGLLKGSISLGAYNSMLVDFVPRVICNFSNVYSNIEFHLQELAYAAFHELLPKGIIDLGFMVDDVPKGFTFIPLFRDSACVIMRDDHMFASYEKIPPGLLNGCDFIMPMRGFDDIINIVLQKTPFYPNIKYHVASDVAAMALVSNGRGVSIISSLQVNILPDHVVAREFEGDLGRNLGIAVKSIKHAPPAIREFIRVARETAAQTSLERLAAR